MGGWTCMNFCRYSQGKNGVLGWLFCVVSTSEADDFIGLLLTSAQNVGKNKMYFSEI